VTIAKVEPLTTARALRGPFDYRLPESMGDLGVGSVVRVPFGRQRLLGVVVDLADSSELPAERLAEPFEALEAGAPPELIRRIKREAPELTVYAGFDPYRSGVQAELEYAHAKLAAGADGLFSQPLFDERLLDVGA